MRYARLRHERPALALGVALLVLTLAGPVRAQIEEVSEAEQRVAEVTAALDEATAVFEETRARVEAMEDELASIEQQEVDLRSEAEQVDELLTLRLRTVFKYGGDTVLTSFLSSGDPQDAIERSSLMARATARDQGRLETAVSTRARLRQTQALVQDARDELAVLTAQLDANRRALTDRLADAQEYASVVQARAARQREIRDGRMNGVYSCIFDQGVHRFRDTWGAPRSGGRSHKGVDVFAPYDVNVYAITNGRVSRLTNSGLGGINLYLLGDDGTEYFYAHLAGYAPGIGVGSTVRAGDLVAYNGDTGNARGTPHVHFEAHPGGGRAVNPYPWMVAACR